MALRINAENFEEKVLKADKPVLVDFYSDTCIPCKQMAGILGDIEDTIRHWQKNSRSCPRRRLSVL